MVTKLIKPEDRQHMDFEIWEKEALKDPKLREEYNKLQPEFALLRARIERGLTQKQLAHKMGTKQSVISNLESGKRNPSISFLQKFAEALNTHLEIKFVPG